MEYKLCVCDMDGTLLNSKGLISLKNEKALKCLIDKGVEVIIASGRTDLMMKPFIKQLDLKGYIICCNGALIKHIGKKEIIYCKPIEKNTANMAIKYCMDNKLNFLVYTEEFVYSNSNNPRAKQFVELNENLPLELHAPIEYFDYNEKNIFDNKTVIKILLVEDDDEKRNNYINYFEKFQDLAVVTSAKGLLDIWSSNISKGSAIKALAEKLNINLSQVVVFGDNYNDMEMFKVAGMPVAMENAVDELKRIAKYVTLSNDEDGIAHAISYLWDNSIS